MVEKESSNFYSFLYFKGGAGQNALLRRLCEVLRAVKKTIVLTILSEDCRSYSPEYDAQSFP